jgi:uncharacterized membrane protein
MLPCAARLGIVIEQDRAGLATRMDGWNEASGPDTFHLMQMSRADSRSKPGSEERFTHRLEAFGDLVFGFSLSLLATRLDVPESQADVFAPTRWGTFIITFGMICAIWLAHYRIFRHRFVARPADVIVNFVFLFGIAVLPYAVQTFLRFNTGLNSIILYLGDFALILGALATLRWSALRQRRNDDDVDARVREWRATVRQTILVITIVFFLAAANTGLIPTEKFFSVLPAAIVVITLVVRSTVRRLPRFLDSERS